MLRSSSGSSGLPSTANFCSNWASLSVLILSKKALYSSSIISSNSSARNSLLLWLVVEDFSISKFLPFSISTMNDLLWFWELSKSLLEIRSPRLELFDSSDDCTDAIALVDNVGELAPEVTSTPDIFFAGVNDVTAPGIITLIEVWLGVTGVDEPEVRVIWPNVPSFFRLWYSLNVNFPCFDNEEEVDIVFLEGNDEFPFLFSNELIFFRTGNVFVVSGRIWRDAYLSG